MKTESTNSNRGDDPGHAESWWTNVETFLSESAMDRLAESKVTFTTHCPINAGFVANGHNNGLRCFPYVTFYVGSDNALWNGQNFSAYQGVDFSKHKFYEIDAAGNPTPSPFGASTNDGVGVTLNPCFVTCPNVPEYQDKMIEWVEHILKTGADGVFVDNLFTRQTCDGARRGIHRHLFPDPANPADASAQNQAFARLLQRVRDAVKKVKPDGKVLGNSGNPLNVPLEFQQYLDRMQLRATFAKAIAGNRDLRFGKVEAEYLGMRLAGCFSLISLAVNRFWCGATLPWFHRRNMEWPKTPFCVMQVLV